MARFCPLVIPEESREVRQVGSFVHSGISKSIFQLCDDQSFLLKQSEWEKSEVLPALNNIKALLTLRKRHEIVLRLFRGEISYFFVHIRIFNSLWSPLVCANSHKLPVMQFWLPPQGFLLENLTEIKLQRGESGVSPPISPPCYRPPPSFSQAVS